MSKPAWKKYPDWLRKEDRDAWTALDPAARAIADTPGRRLMYEDGATLSLIAVTNEERHESWRNNPPQAMPVFLDKPRDEDAQTKAFREELERAEQAKAERKRAPATPREPKTPRPSREGLVTVAALAQEYGMIPRLARAALRAARVPKPPQGWAFAPGSELEATIRAALAAAKDSPPRPKQRPGDPSPTRAHARAVKAEARAKSASPIPTDATWSGSKKDRKRWQKSSAPKDSASPSSFSVKPNASTSSKTRSARPSKTSKKSTTGRSPSTKSRKTSAKR